MKQRVDYQEYLASREWRLKRKEVIDFAEGVCERCGSARIQDVHHNNYRNIGNEDPALPIVMAILMQHGLHAVYGPGEWPPRYWHSGESQLGFPLNIDVAPADADPGPGANLGRLKIPIAVGVVGYCFWG